MTIDTASWFTQNISYTIVIQSALCKNNNNKNAYKSHLKINKDKKNS